MNGTSLLAGRARALVSAFCVACASLAGAQEQSASSATDAPAAEPATPQPPGSPEASRAVPDDDLPELDELVIVGRRRRGEAERDPTASATVVHAAQFAGEAKGVAELVATSPGVAVADYGGLGHYVSVSIRGAGADGVLLLLDGIPLNNAFGGGVDLASIPRAWIDRIEVVRGVEGAHYGAGALGGVVNAITRGGRTPGWSTELTGGSFDTASLSADAAFPAGGGELFLAVSGESSGGGFPYRFDRQPSVAGNPLTAQTRENDATRRGGILAKLSRPFGEARLDVVGQLSAGRRELPGSPYRLTPRDWQEDARALLVTRLSAPAPWRRTTLGARVSLRSDWLTTRVDPAVIEQRGSAAGIGTEAKVLHAGGTLKVALEAEGESLTSDGLDQTRSRGSVAAAISDDAFLARDRVRVGPAVRVERIGPFSGWSAKLGGAVQLAGPVALRASAGRTFRAPSISELYLTQGIAQPNPELRPEEGLGGDAALVLDHPLVHAAVGGHATLYRDLVYWELASLGRLKPFNAGKALVRGVEAEVATVPYRPLLGLSLAGSYTFLDTENLRAVEDALGKDLPRRAPHRLFARAAIAPGRFGAHLEAHHVSRQFADVRNLREISASTTFNVGAAFRLTRARNLALHAEVRNVLDDRTLQDPLGNPLPGRMVLVAIRGGSRAAEVMP